VSSPGRCSSPKRHKGSTALVEEVAEALCGVLVDVFALADYYHVELDELYLHLLARLVSSRRGEARGPGNDAEAGWKAGTAMIRPAAGPAGGV